jgi:hypothetical protein
LLIAVSLVTGGSLTACGHSHAKTQATVPATTTNGSFKTECRELTPQYFGGFDVTCTTTLAHSR